MTLIVGTPHWNGICINSDTRQTNIVTGKTTDNACKIAHIHGGFGMVASGNSNLAIIIRNTIRKRLDDFALLGIKFDSTINLENVVSFLISSALNDIKKHKSFVPRPINKTFSSGLIGVSIPDQNLRLNKQECNNLLSIIIEGSQGLPINSHFYNKYMMKIVDCVDSRIPYVVFKEYPCSSLYQYKLNIGFTEEDDVVELSKVNFGEIIAFGSGSQFDYSSKRNRVLFFVLFNNNFMDTELGAIHLSMIHEYAEDEVQSDNVFNIKTFGGAIVPGIVRSDSKGNSETGIVLCDLGSKKKNQLISRTYKKEGSLWVSTRSGEQVKLNLFPSDNNLDELLYWV